jgi:dCMP deaminase
MSKWDSRFFDLARNVSTWSKDPSRKIGAVAINPEKKTILSTGYNGFPRGIDDSEERLNDRPTKYKLISHAEMNLIYNATYTGTCLDGADIYTVGLPVCSECAKGIIQVGIKRVFMELPTDMPQNWIESGREANAMFAEAGVKVIMVNV